MGAVADPAKRTTPPAYMAVEIDLYRNATLMGSTHNNGMSWPGFNRFTFHVPADPASVYEITIEPASPHEDELQYEGWTYAQAVLQINGGSLWGARKPLSWYTAEPTDWPSGLVRWRFEAVPGGPQRGIAVVPVPPVSYSALIRRPS